MTTDNSTAQQKTRARTNRTWLNNNQDRSQRLDLVLPTLTHRDLIDAGEKSGLSMTGLVMAAAQFLRETDGKTLQELAIRSASLQGFRMQYVDQETGETRRVSGGPYRKGPANE